VRGTLKLIDLLTLFDADPIDVCHRKAKELGLKKDG
jgi:hypothetical protein